MTKDQISGFIRQRNNLLRSDKKASKQQADQIEADILKAIKKDFNGFEVDFIIETVTHFGACPNIVFDDNGNFAVTCAGYQPVVTGNQKIEGAMTVFVEKYQWKKTIRLALKHFLANYNK